MFILDLVGRFDAGRRAVEALRSGSIRGMAISRKCLTSPAETPKLKGRAESGDHTRIFCMTISSSAYTHTSALSNRRLSPSHRITSRYGVVEPSAVM